MPNSRTGLIEAARILLETASKEPVSEDLTGDEMKALYGVLKNTNILLQSYTVTKTPELREGSRSSSVEVQRAMWILEEAWLQRYSRSPVQNIVPMPLRRAV